MIPAIDTTHPQTLCSPRILTTCQMVLDITRPTPGPPAMDFRLPHIPQCCQATVIILKHIPACITLTTWVTPMFLLLLHPRTTWDYPPCQHSDRAPPSLPPHTPPPHPRSMVGAAEAGVRGRRPGTPSTKLWHLYIHPQIIPIVATVQIPPPQYLHHPQDHQVSGRDHPPRLLPRPTLKGETPSILCKVVWKSV